jgi:hypothetical protein
MSRTRRIHPAEKKEVKEEKNNGRDEIEFSMELRRQSKRVMPKNFQQENIPDVGLNPWNLCPLDLVSNALITQP